MKKYLGIRNLTGREPVGVVLSVGIKDKMRGFPTETDRFHLVNPRENNGVRDHHIAFRPFNSAPAEKRKVIYGNLVHATRTECFEFQLKAQVLNKAHPNRMPCCMGDGERATRWMGGAADNFKEIVCPHEKCEFRQTKPPLCKPFMRFLFRLRWDKSNGFTQMPEPLVKFTSGSWNTTSHFKGFFEYIEMTARNLGMQNYTLFGFPFMMTLAYQTKPSEKTRFPVVTVTPEADPVAFFMQQRENISRLLGGTSVPISITSGEEQDVSVVYEDVRGISGNGISIPTQSLKETSRNESSQGKNEPTESYEPPQIPIPSDWGKKWRKQEAFEGKTWAELSDDVLDLTMRTNRNEKLRKAAFCELKFRKDCGESLFPDDWHDQRKSQKGRGCSVPYKDLGAKTLENLRKEGDMNAVYEMRYKIDLKGEPIPSDDKLFSKLQKLNEKK